MDSLLPQYSRLFLTGGTGFFGKCLLEALSNLNEDCASSTEVVVLSRDPERFLGGNIRFAAYKWLSFVQGDILDFDFPSGIFTHVIHAATDTSDAAARNPVALFDQIVMGTHRTLDFALTCGAQRFLLASSGAVYGPQPEGITRIPETYQGAPETSDVASTYGQAKRAAEQLCTAYHIQYGLQTTIARCFAFVGEYLPLDGHFAIGNFISDALRGDAIRVKGDGSPVRSYLYGADLATWLLTILAHGKSAYPYNVGSDQAITIAELARLVGRIVAPGKPVLIEKSRPDYSGRSQYVPDISRARNELGLRVVAELAVAIRLTAFPETARSHS